MEQLDIGETDTNTAESKETINDDGRNDGVESVTDHLKKKRGSHDELDRLIPQKDEHDLQDVLSTATRHWENHILSRAFYRWMKLCGREMLVKERNEEEESGQESDDSDDDDDGDNSSIEMDDQQERTDLRRKQLTTTRRGARGSPMVRGD